jgi:hypothetical protein
MLDSLLLLNSLNDAITFLKTARAMTAGGSSEVWGKLYDAHKYLDKQVEELLAPPPVEEEVVANAA